MTHRAAALPALWFALAASCPADLPDWENPAVFRIGKEAPRATAMPFPDLATALAKRRLESPWCQSLNGSWKFQLVGNPQSRPRGFEAPEFDASKWADLPVPSNWQLHGHGTPVYTNSEYPFAADPPRVMGTPPAHFLTFPESNRNQVGCYRHEFTVPADWKNRPVYLHFAGVDSALRLWLNGKFVGYSEDSRTPAEFLITRHLREGSNLLAAEVYQYSDGSYLEDQDMWRLSGIFRDVYLWSPPAIEMNDHWVRAGLTDDFRTGTLSVDASLRNHGPAAKATLRFTLFQPSGGAATLATAETTAELPADSTTAVKLAPPAVPQAQPWSAESPTLYPYALTVVGADGKELAHYAGRTGFRRNEVKDGQFLHNGQPILFKGVNRHDHSPRGGKYVREYEMLADLLQMKRAHINAIRCAHYPNDPRFLELCDELGFYVIDEANIEAHGMGWGADANPLAKDPAWGPAHLDRVKNMLERDKNHPSVVMWSMGNESGDGINFQECSKWIKQRDPSRPVHYEQAGERPHVDVISPMYTPVDDCVKFCRREEQKPLAQQRPMILCEYNHAMGNSSGNLAEYWAAFRKERLLQGGFIWDWKDQGLARKKHAIDAAEDRSPNPAKARLLGSLSPEEGLYGGGVVVDPSPKLDLAKSVTVVAEARGNFGGPKGQGSDDNNRNESAGYPILTKGDSAWSLKVDQSGSRIEFFIHDGKTWQSLFAPLPDDWRARFHRFAGSYDGTRMILSIDGTPVAEQALACPIPVTRFPVAVGLDTEEPSRRFDGSIRRATVYQRALAPAELAAQLPEDGRVLDFDFTADAIKPLTRPILAYGGDFNDRPTQKSFCCNGIVQPNLAKSPQFDEVLRLHQEVQLDAVDLSKPDVRLRLLNERYFRPLDDMRASWKLLKDGVQVGTGELALPQPPLAPQKTADLLVATGHTPAPDGEYILRVRFDRTTDSRWSPARYPVAWAEFALPWSKRKPPVPAAEGQAPDLAESPDSFTVTGPKFSARVDRHNGALTSWKIEEREFLTSPLQFHFWRPPVNNDEGAKLHRHMRVWRRAGEQAVAEKVTATKDKSSVTVRAELRLPAGDSRATVHYRFHATGQVAVDCEFLPAGQDLPIIPRVGMRCGVPADLFLWTWYGKGPHENHIDRNAGAWTTVHSGSITQLFHRYLDPQNSGNRTEIRWSTLTDAKGKGIRIDAAGEHLLEITAQPYSDDDIELARHPSDLISGSTVTLHIDHRQMGVGGTNSWGQWPLPAYRIEPNTPRRWSFLLGPGEGVAAPPTIIRRPQFTPSPPPQQGPQPLPPRPPIPNPANPANPAVAPVAPPPAGSPGPAPAN